MSPKLRWIASTGLILFAACGRAESDSADYAAETANPCAAAINPCAANPCAAAMNPCAAADAGQELDVAAIRQGDRPLNAHGKGFDELVAMGEKLWADPGISGTASISCASCHAGDGTAMMNASFTEPYPHPVAMAKQRAGLETVNAAEMVQLCMAIPMNATPFDYQDVELAALTAFVTDMHKRVREAGSLNPCAADLNPCAANPCAAGNPCAGM